MLDASDDSSETPSSFILAIDQGTDMTTALLVDACTLEIVAQGQRPIETSFPAPGCFEHDADDIWQSTVRAIDECLVMAPGVVPAGVALSTQRENAVVWSRATGTPLGPVLAWQDSRTQETCAALAQEWGELVHHATGLALDPLYSGAKMKWLVEHALENGASADDICVGTIDAWLLWNLTGEFVTEAGNASRTLMCDLQHLNWTPELVSVFGIPMSSLPRVLPSNDTFGLTVATGRLPAEVPVCTVMADSHASLYFHGCLEPGTGKVTYKAGCSIMTPAASHTVVPDGVTTTIAWLTDVPTYAREGNTVSSGSALEWAAQFIGRSVGSNSEKYLGRLARDVPDTGGVTFVPAFGGLAAPYWDRHATSIISGVTGATSRAHLARAALEAVGHQVADVLGTIESDGFSSFDVVQVDGEWTRSAVLMQLQADLLGRPLEIAEAEHASALGVALMAARVLGLIDENAVRDVCASSQRFEPSIDAKEREKLRREWATTIARSRGHAVP